METRSEGFAWKACFDNMKFELKGAFIVTENSGKCYLQWSRKLKRLPVDVCRSKTGTLFSRGFRVTVGNRKWRASSTCFITKTFVLLEKVQLTILAKNGPQPCSRRQLKQLWKRFSSNISHWCFMSVVWPPPPPSKLSDVNGQRTPDVLSPPSPINIAKVARTRTFSIEV